MNEPRDQLLDFSANIKEKLAEILKSKDKLESIASRSFVHANGFKKIVLEDHSNNGWKLRLHIWTRDYQSYAQGDARDLHDHRWSYISTPLAGTIKETRYIEAEASDKSEGDLKFKIHCYSRNEEQNINTEKREKVTLQKMSEAIYSKGEIYSCPAGDIHLLEPIEFPAITLVLTYGSVKDYARVYHDKEMEHKTSENFHPNMTVEDLEQSLVSILNL